MAEVFKGRYTADVGQLGDEVDKGLLAFRGSLFPQILLVQYWRSFDDLERFARNAAARIGVTDGDTPALPAY